MSKEINYKAVYELRDLTIVPLDTLKIAARLKAEQEAVKQFNVMKAAIEKHIGHDNFYFSDISCLAKGIANHVYVGDPKRDFVQRGAGKYKCLFCNCDDFIE